MIADSLASHDGYNWLLTNLVRNTDGIRDAVAVSSDGLLLAKSGGLDRDEADHLAAVVSGLSSLAKSAARRYEFNGMKLIMIEMHRGFLLISTILDNSCVGVLAEQDCDLGLIGYEMAVFADRSGEVLTPALISELRRALSQ